MAILVVCSGCQTRFQVSDQFAGKSGPCPKCKQVIKIPGKTAEVKIHGGEEFSRGGRDAAGKLVLKPVARQETRFHPKTAAIIAGAALAAAVVTWLAGGLLRDDAFAALLARTLGLLVISPPIVVAAYTFLRDDELEPYAGKPLYKRTAICAVVYIVLWGAFGYASERLITEDLWTWLYVAPPFLIVGALTGLACFDFDFSSGFFHYAFFLLVTGVFRWLAGMPWPWQIVVTGTGAAGG